MKAEEALQIAVNNPEILALSGSRLYGTNRENSDIDLRGVCIPPYEYIIGNKVFTDTEIPGADHKVYSLKRYFELALKGDPQMTEVLFTPENQIVKITPVGKLLLENKNLFLSKRIFRRIMGYGNSEFRKAMGVKLVFENQTKEDKDFILETRNYCKENNIEQDDVEDIIDILLSKKERKLVSSLNNLGAKRKADFDRFGFGVSSAAHSVRLYGELKELLLTGHITFPRPDADLLKSIRFGKLNKEEVQKIYEEKVQEAKDAEIGTKLPDNPDEKAVWNLYLKIIKDFLKNDVRFNA